MRRPHKKEEKPLSEAKREKLKCHWETKENDHTPRKLLSLLSAAVHVRPEEHPKRRPDTKESKAKQPKVAFSPTRDENEQNIPSAVLEDMHQAMEILRAESAHETLRFVNVDTLNPFEKREIIEAPPKPSADEEETPMVPTKALTKEEPSKSTSIIEQWKLAHKPALHPASTPAEPESQARSARWAQSCLSADTEALQKEFPPEEFTDLIDPVGFGETNPHPPVFRALPSKAAKLVPVHRMSKAKRKGVLNRDSQPAEDSNS
ncbi:Zinc metalloprotease zmpB [Perkinsela sp. CCAP 1560/4]|nr:Zinc metalloprotease zmpB [Perkinsela sp. CCAP 1560/4]|eukprot:KNH05446.1 Zinc metalloprotease zmpB [Perkinsela sp. CCAP 1560/4]